MTTQRPKSRVDKASTYYPLLVKNPAQLPDNIVLSFDGKSVHTALPDGGVLISYTEKETWHFDRCIGLLGGQPLWESIYEALERLQHSEARLRRLRRIAQRDPLHDELIFEEPLPATDRRKGRQCHILLQVVLSIDDGCDFDHGTCPACRGKFLMGHALSKSRFEERSLPMLCLGFSEMIQFIREGTISCPVCDEQMVLDFSQNEN